MENARFNALKLLKKAKTQLQESLTYTSAFICLQYIENSRTMNFHEKHSVDQLKQVHYHHNSSRNLMFRSLEHSARCKRARSRNNLLITSFAQIFLKIRCRDGLSRLVEKEEHKSRDRSNIIHFHTFSSFLDLFDPFSVAPYTDSVS